MPAALPADVLLRPLEPHPDARGTFIELFRASWGVGVVPVQWNAVRSEANVLRGVHAHHTHGDYLTLAWGRATVGLYDLREESPTAGLAALVELRADAPASLVIPPGVAHGFYLHEPSLHVYAVTHEWDPEDELGCRFDDPALGIEWPSPTPVLSPRDEALGSLRQLSDAVNARLRERRGSPRAAPVGA